MAAPSGAEDAIQREMAYAGSRSGAGGQSAVKEARRASWGHSTWVTTVLAACLRLLYWTPGLASGGVYVAGIWKHDLRSTRPWELTAAVDHSFVDGGLESGKNDLKCSRKRHFVLTVSELSHITGPPGGSPLFGFDSIIRGLEFC